MKRMLLTLMTVGFLVPFATRAQAETEVSLNFFYDNLSDQGSWIEVGDYGYCFQPAVAVSDPNWRPYADGYWAYTDAGWTWVSYEDFGWATYHYGRWTRLTDYGWVWVPGYDWGPAWVSWRTGGDYVGWAPLPPQGDEVVYEGRPITGAVDVTFGIGPLYYNFVDIRYIGEPVLRARLIEPARNVTIISNTVNVTNITYNNSVVINNGPDLNRVNQYSVRPIQHLALQREATVPANAGQGGRRGNFNRVNGNQFVVVTPRIQKSQQQMAPKQVKAKVETQKIERGWEGVANRQQIETQMKKENPRKILPPNFEVQKGPKTDNATAAPPNESARPRPASRPANNQDAARAAQQEAAARNARLYQQPPQHPSNSVDQKQAARRAQSPDTPQQDRSQQAAQQIQESQRAAAALRAQQLQEAQRADHLQRAQQAQQQQHSQEHARPVEQPDQPVQAQPVQRHPQPKRAPHPELNQQPPAAPLVQPQGNQQPNAEHKKKKPGDEQPTPH